CLGVLRARVTGEAVGTARAHRPLDVELRLVPADRGGSVPRWSAPRSADRWMARRAPDDPRGVDEAALARRLLRFPRRATCPAGVAAVPGLPGRLNAGRELARLDSN